MKINYSKIFLNQYYMHKIQVKYSYAKTQGPVFQSVFSLTSYSHLFSKNISIYGILDEQRFNDMSTNDIVSFEQLCPDWHAHSQNISSTFIDY